MTRKLWAWVSQMLPIALLAMVAMTNVSGWGPPEGVTTPLGEGAAHG